MFHAERVEGAERPDSSYLTVEDVAAWLRMSKRSVHERTRLGLIPHRRIAGTRRCLFLEDELKAWLDGAPLTTVHGAGGTRVVRPLEQPRGESHE